MFDTGETLEDIERWAEATFPHEFKAVKDYLIENDITAKEYCHKDKHTSARVRSVQVGSVGEPARPVISHVTSEENDPVPWVALCRMPVDGNDCQKYSIRDTRFVKPFSWLKPAKSLLGSWRFEALIQFICPPSELSAADPINVRYFKIYFEGACRVISGKLEEQRCPPNGKCNQCFYYSKMAQL